MLYGPLVAKMSSLRCFPEPKVIRSQFKTGQISQSQLSLKKRLRLAQFSSELKKTFYVGLIQISEVALQMTPSVLPAF